MNLLRNIAFLIFCCTFSVQAETTFSDFIKDKTSHKGYFTFLYDEQSGKVYLEIEQFEQNFLFQSGLPQGLGSNDIGLDRGQLGDTRLVRFERVGKKVFLRQLNTYYRANSDNALEKQAVEEAFASSIIWGFNVAKVSESGKKVLIDYTPFLLSDIHNIAEKLKKRKQGNYKVDVTRSGFYSKRSKAFPDNTELEATVTFKGTDAGDFLKSVTPDAGAVSVNLHHSLIKLPDDNFDTRDFHPFSGFWSFEYADYASAIEEPLLKRVIPRHRLVKKDQDKNSSEAIEPIVYYLDAGVPEPVRSALIEGAQWWDQAFEAIGYKNAFQVKMLPADVDPMDVRYNIIQWVHRATRGWSYGSSVIDPRTGEIIKGHVTLGSLRVRQDYLIALGLTSPFTPNEQFSNTTDVSIMKEMALARIRQLAAHEVGHTLGIAHNFSASANNRASVMDYPHPYIGLVDDEIDLSQAYAKNIGKWDKYVIAYGYGSYTPEDESASLLSLVKKAQQSGLHYISDPDARPKSGGHATGHLWDNGDDAVKELHRLLTVRAKALDNFGITSIAYGTPLSELEQTLVPIYNLHRYQVEATAKLIAGLDYSYEVRDDNNHDGVSIVNAKTQQAAIEAIIATLDDKILTLPEHIIHLIPPKAYGYRRDRESFISNTGLAFDPISAAEASIKHSLGMLLNAQRLARLQQQAMMNKNIPTVKDLLKKLIENTVENSDVKGLNALVKLRLNQQVVDHLLAIWHQKNVVTELRAEVYVSLTSLVKWLEDHEDGRHYKKQSSQFALLKQQIAYSLAQGKIIAPKSTVKLAPGSPIGSE